jgi:type IV pilus assembly protein PilY1
VPLTDTTRLVQQTIGADQTAPNGNTYAAISTNAVDYTGTTPKRGWYMNLPKTGQRNVYPLDLLATRFALADTISPSTVSLDPCINTSGGIGFQYIFDALTGAGPTEAILDTNGDGNISTADLIVSGVAGSADGRNVSIVISSNAQSTKYANVSAQSGATLIQISCRLTGTCATSSTGIKHQVRQLFLR